MADYIINSFRGGIGIESDKGAEGAFKGGYALDIRKRNDTLSCKQDMLDNTPSGMNDLGRYFVPATDGSLYVFGSAGSIWAWSEDTGWTFAYNDENGEIKGAAEWKNSDDERYLYWATDTSIARKRLIGTGTHPWDDATQDYKTTLDSHDYHTMKAAAGQLNIANGNFLATIDFEDDFDVSALNIRPGNLIKALEERDDYIILGSFRDDDSEQGHIWSWVITALNWVQKKLIPVKGVNALITAEIPLIQGGTDGELFTSDFATTLPLHGIPGGGQVNPGGVAVEDDVALFGVYGANSSPGVYSLGRKRSNHPFALNYDYRLVKDTAGSVVTEIGALTMYNGTLFASWETTDESTLEYGIDQVSSTTKATAVYEGLEFDNDEPHLERLYEHVKLLMRPMPSGTSVSAKFKLDYQDNWQYATLGDQTTTVHAVSEGLSSTIAEFIIGDRGVPLEIGIELNPTGNESPEVKGIVTSVSDEVQEHG